jgi:flagellar hook-associated protein 3 FlgL
LNSGDGDNFIFGGIKTDAAPIENYFADPAPPNKAALDSAFAGAFGFNQTDPAVANITPAQMSAFLSGDFQSLFAPAQWKSTWSQASDEPMKNQISISRSIDASITANEPAMRKLAAAYVMASDIGNERLSQDTRRTVAKAAMETIDSAIALLTQTQARAGVMQATVDSANNAMDVQSTTLRLQLADLEGIDQTEAAARANILMTQIQSAYTLTSRISQLSLSKYL